MMSSLRCLAVVSVVVLMSLTPRVAGAQQACPPGAWFCVEVAPVTPASPPSPSTPPPPLPAPVEPPPPPPVVVIQPPVVYDPYPPPRVVRPVEPPPPYVMPAREPVWMHRSEWGLNLRVQGAMMSKRDPASDTLGMGGAGIGLRYKPSPYFGLEVGADFFSGRDYYDYKRTEQAFSINGLVFLTPKSRAQLYLVGGIGWSSATVRDDSTSSSQDVKYGYFGGQAGIGLELRMARNFALNFDMRGFIRGRTDSKAREEPEFRDATGRTTNTSGGGIFTLGMTFYF